jgi:bifunctional UDP-N-acetylglucosamine pyrophosphorylase/glucosamine-1-phosphate N-acetyltransferase
VKKKSSSKPSSNPSSPALDKLACIVLAAGKGTRMRSAKVKVLHTLLGAPLITYPIERARALGAAPVIAVLGHQKSEVEAALGARYGAGAIPAVEQAEQKGTGHAVKLGLAPLADWDGIVLILYGDVPLLEQATLESLCAEARRTGGLALLTARVADPTGYGRIVRDHKDRVKRIVEHKDATKAERKLDEINAGVYAAPAAFLRAATAALKNDNAQGEYYFTDVVHAAAKSIGATAVDVSPDQIAGVNDRRQLVEAETVLRHRLLAALGERATFRDPASTLVEAGVEIGEDAEIGRNVSLRGRTKIGAGARIDDGCVLTNTVVGVGAELKPYSIATDSVIGPGCVIGPFAHLRPGTDLAAEVHLGNFVETKKTRVGRGSKANHLSYLGDAVIGEKVNVGAGTITCNYNGYEKRETIIEDGAFIGSDTQLIAPVRVGKRAVVAAGTTVTADVPDGALALSRVPQTHKEGYADQVAARYARKTDGKPTAKAPSDGRPARGSSPERG